MFFQILQILFLCIFHNNILFVALIYSSNKTSIRNNTINLTPQNNGLKHSSISLKRRQSNIVDINNNYGTNTSSNNHNSSHGNNSIKYHNRYISDAGTRTNVNNNANNDNNTNGNTCDNSKNPLYENHFDFTKKNDIKHFVDFEQIEKNEKLDSKQKRIQTKLLTESLERRRGVLCNNAETKDNHIDNWYRRVEHINKDKQTYRKYD